ncbi:MAG TPA: hypothetical protein VFF65_11130 [Phycisphaerales bacterium]|nr:hypothetical protein [Phycisphaerales bacterium]
MGVFDLFKKKGGPSRTALIGAPGPAFYDMLGKKVSAAGATLSPDSIENIRSVLSPLAKMGADIDAQLEKIRVEVDKSGRPNQLVVRTTVAGKPMGPQTTFDITQVDAKTCRVKGHMTMPTGGGMKDKLLMAGLSRRLEQDSKLAFDQPIADAAKTLGASVKFED